MSCENNFLDSFDPRQRAWVEVSPAAIKSNTQKINSCIGDDCLLMAVVKADGYGHGAETVAKATLLSGAKSLGVATLQEGLELRQADVDCPILVLGNLYDPDDLAACLKWNLMPTLSSLREAILCENLANGSGKTFKVHMKVDTGMTRLGCDISDAPDLIESINTLENLTFDGFYSHLALADRDSVDDIESLTILQKNKFDELVKTYSLRDKKVCCHLANSAGTIKDKGLHYDMVRVGLAIYGYNPIPNACFDLGLNPAFKVKARITLIRDVKKGVGVSYGHKFITKRQSKLAVVSIGYADGVSRALSGKINVLIDNKFVPQVGSITMDQLVLDVTDFPNAKVGTEVILLGQNGNLSISPQDWSSFIGSIPWEVLCGFKHRLPRVVI